MKVVLDTNVMVSAMLGGSRCVEILRKVVTNHFTAVISDDLITETNGILSRKFSFPAARLYQLEDIMVRRFEKVFPTITIAVCRDEADNRVLEAAITGECDYLVTGDKDLLVLKSVEGIVIISPVQFLEIIIT